LIWKTKKISERIGTDLFHLEVLENLEQTIDDLFLLLEKEGNPELLESLCPYFGQVWPSARALTEYLSKNSLEKKSAVRVLEVGCGLALPSLYLAKTLKYSKIFASDSHPEVPRFLTTNLALNHLTDLQLRYLTLDWSKKLPIEEDPEQFHVVMGSDILYEKQHPAEVADALCRWVKPSGQIIVADPARPYLQVFVNEMKARGWFSQPQVIKVSDGVDGKKEVFILDFKRGR
jgi:predicted nicotinamide N-methyase